MKELHRLQAFAPQEEDGTGHLDAFLAVAKAVGALQDEIWELKMQKRPGIEALT